MRPKEIYYRRIADSLREASSIILDNRDIDEEFRNKLYDRLAEFLKELDEIIDDLAFDFLAAGIAVDEIYLRTYALIQALLLMKQQKPSQRYKIIPRPTYFRYLKKIE